jgi:UDP-N-acetylglucosamine acyltransferase
VGKRTRIGAHVVLGGAPQVVRDDAGPARLEIGEDNTFREFSTAHVGSSRGSGITRIGDRNWFMCNAHVAHDCVVGSDCVFANSAAIGGHVFVGDSVTLGGLSGIHQHVRIGRLAMIGAGSICTQDIPPFSLAQGDRARLFGLNVVGLRRAGLDGTAIKAAWRVLFTQGLALSTAMARVRETAGESVEVDELLAFLAKSHRGICRAASVGAS